MSVKKHMRNLISMFFLLGFISYNFCVMRNYYLSVNGLQDSPCDKHACQIIEIDCKNVYKTQHFSTEGIPFILRQEVLQDCVRVGDVKDYVSRYFEIKEEPQYPSPCVFIDYVRSKTIQNINQLIPDFYPGFDILLRGNYNYTFPHVDVIYPNLNVYVLLVGEKKVNLVSAKITETLPLAMTKDSLTFMKDNWKSHVKWYYEASLNPGDILVFDSTSMLHQFLSSGYTSVLSRRYISPLRTHPQIWKQIIQPNTIAHYYNFAIGKQVCRLNYET